MRFRRAVQVDVGFYTLGLPSAAERVYFYLSSRCATRFHVSEVDISRTLRMDIRVARAAINLLVDINLVLRWQFPRPKCTEYLVTLTTHKNWGIGGNRTYSIGGNRTPLRGASVPINRGHPSLPPKTKDNNNRLGKGNDTELFAIFQRHFVRWPFNRKPIGKQFHFTRPMMGQAIECMRHLNSSHATVEQFDTFLSSCGEYLSLPRDVLGSGKDQRAVSPVAWLNHWHEQVRLAGIYDDEKREKVTRITVVE